MRQYSKVSPKIWTGRVGKAIRGDRDAQIVAFYLLTCPHANMIGLFHLPMAYLIADTGLSPKGASKGLRRGSDVAFLRYDEATERVWVVDHLRHELGEDVSPGDKRLRGASKLLEEHACSVLYVEFVAKYGDLIGVELEAPSKGLARTIEAPPISGAGAGTGTEAGTGDGECVAEAGSTYTKDFETFWSRYPRKIGKGKAQAAWKRAKKRPDLDKILEAVRKQAQSPRWIEGTIPNPETWINQRRWDDDPATYAAVGNGKLKSTETEHQRSRRTGYPEELMRQLEAKVEHHPRWKGDT